MTKQWDYSVYKECQFCGAKAGKPCTDSLGELSAPHSGRAKKTWGKK